MKFTIGAVAAITLALAATVSTAQAQMGSTGQTSGSAYTPNLKAPGIQDDLGGAEAKKNPQGIVGQYDMGGAQSQAPTASQAGAQRYEASGGGAQNSNSR